MQNIFFTSLRVIPYLFLNLVQFIFDFHIITIPDDNTTHNKILVSCIIESFTLIYV